MRLHTAFLVLSSVIALGSVLEGEASACGGCFVQQSENTQVTGHKMILSVSMDQTTLYDQISYSGNPAEFAWVLPIRGQVDIGLSSDALFQLLEQNTNIQIDSPTINCGSPQFCGDAAFGSGSGGGSAGGEDPSVTVIAQEVVGPYETVQLASNDPAALSAWLTSHGYNVPSEIQPVIDAYVGEGFGFLALRLVPGQGVNAMKPVRVTSPGAGPGLPLRMVAAGTGAITPITLFVMSEGRYEPSNFPTFTIDPSALVWDWDQAKSNYSTLRAQGFAAGAGNSWLMEAAEPAYQDYFWQLTDLASYDPVGSGYGDDTATASAAVAEDIAVLTAGINPDSMWISRMSAELPRASLSTDLTLGAAADQSTLQRYFQVQNTVGTPPECPPPPPPCDDYYGGSGGSDVGGGGGVISCSAAPGTSDWGALGGVFAAVGLGLRVRRNRKG